MLPNDANLLGNMLGGRVMHLIDIAGALAANRHSNSHVVTASVDYLDFRFPIRVGEWIVLKSSVNRVFHTSMEVGVKVFAENILTGERQHTSSAYVTFVALDLNQQPRAVPPLILETEEERRRYREAGERRRDAARDAAQNAGRNGIAIGAAFASDARDQVLRSRKYLLTASRGLKSILDAFPERRSFQIISRKK